MRSISKRVEQTHLDLQECLQVHHPNSSDDDVAPRRRRAPRATPMAEDVWFPLFFYFFYYCLFVVLRQFFCLLKLLDLYYSVSRVLLRPLGGVIFMTVSFYYSVLPFVSLWQKGGVIFIFGPGMYFQTGQVIFVPEWPKGEFVSIFASFCVWTKSLMCNDVVNRDSTFRVMSEDSQVPYQPSGRSSHPVRTPIFLLLHLFGRCVIPSGRPDSPASSIRTTCFFRPDTSLYREVYVPACSVRTF